MITLFFAILVRGLSGFKNAFYYMSETPNYNNPSIPYKTKRAKWIWIIISSITLVSAMFWSMCEYLNNIWSLLMFIPALFVGLILQIFYFDDSKKIHIVEYLITGSWTIVIIILGADILALMCGLYLGLAFFNMPIQWVSTGRIINKVSITDDSTGKTTGYYIGPLFIKMPRISNGYTTLEIGLLTTSLYCIFTYFYPHTKIDLSFVMDCIKNLF